MTDFAVAPLRKSSRLFVIGMALLLPLGIMVGSLLLTGPDNPKAWLMLLLPPAVFLIIGGAATRRAITLENGRLTIKAAFYTRRLNVSDIDLDQARVVDLNEHRELRPGLKTNGYALPGFSAGHFRGRDKRKVFCLVTHPKALNLPLRDGARILLSPERPQALLDALRRTDGADRRD